MISGKSKIIAVYGFLGSGKTTVQQYYEVAYLLWNFMRSYCQRSNNSQMDVGQEGCGNQHTINKIVHAITYQHHHTGSFFIVFIVAIVVIIVVTMVEIMMLISPMGFAMVRVTMSPQHHLL